MDLETEIKLMRQELEYLRKFLEDDRKNWGDHIKTAQDYRDRVIQLEEANKSHNTEHIFYRWLFGIVVLIGIFLLGRLYTLGGQI